MNLHIAFCGINCETCKLYRATVDNNEKLKIEVAEKWSKRYKRNFDIDTFYCYGCKSQKVFELCSKCDIKRCNLNRSLEKCDECNQYPCDRINRFIEWQVSENTEVEMLFGTESI